MTVNIAGRLLSEAEKHVLRLPERLRDDLMGPVRQWREKLSTLPHHEHMSELELERLQEESERLEKENSEHRLREEEQQERDRDSIYNHGYDWQDTDSHRAEYSRGLGSPEGPRRNEEDGRGH